MPELSRFYGIVIRMFAEIDERHHTPHIHAIYQNYNATYDFNGNRIAGHLSKKEERLVQAWIEIHKEELETNWANISQNKPVEKIAPLR